MGDEMSLVWRWGKREIINYNIYLSLRCHHQNDSCIKMGSYKSHFNVSLIVRDKVTNKTVPQTTTFEEKGEPKRIRTEVLLLTSLTPYRYAKPADIGRRRHGRFLWTEGNSDRFDPRHGQAVNDLSPRCEDWHCTKPCMTQSSRRPPVTGKPRLCSNREEFELELENFIFQGL